MLTWSRPRWKGYGIALASVLIALGLTLLFQPATQRFPFMFFYAALTVSAGYGGLGPGLLSTVLSVLLVDYFVTPPLYTISFDSIDFLPLGLFVVTALFISSFQSRRRLVEKSMLDQREHYRVTLASIGDAVIATDTRGTITFMNAVAERLTGWSQMEALGTDVRHVFHIINEKTRQPVENPIYKVLQSGATVGLANHTVLISQNGQERPIDDSSAPIQDEHGRISGVILVFHDVTEGKQAEARMQWLASFPEMNRQPVVEIDSVGHLHYSNPASKILFPDLEDAGPGHPFLNLSTTEIASLQKQPSISLLREVYAAGIWFQQLLYCLPDSQRIRIYAIDISQRKQAETRMRRLQRVIEQFSKSLTPAEVVHVVIDQGLAILGAVQGSVLLLSEDKTALDMADMAGYARSVLDDWRRIPIETPVMVTDVVRRGEGVWIDRFDTYLAAYPLAARTPDLKPGARAALPLILNEQTVGVIALTFDQAQPFTEDDKRFMLTLAHQRAQALERSRLYDAERQAHLEAETARQRLRLLADTSALLATTLDYETTLKNLEGILLPAFADYYAVDLVENEDIEKLHRVVARATDAAVLEAIDKIARRFPLDPTGAFLRKALRLGQSHWLPEITPKMLDQAATTPEHAALMHQMRTISSINLPLMVRGEVIGVLSVGMSTSGRHYSAEEVSFGEELARRIAQAIDNARLYHEAQRAERQNAEQAARLSVLADASKAFAENNRELKRLFDTITEHLATLLGDACALRIFSDDGEWMDMVSLFHPDPEVRRLMLDLGADRRPTGLGLFGQVKETGQTIRIPVMTEEDFRRSTPPHLHAYFDRVGSRSLILASLRVADHVVGILSFTRLTPDRPYTEQDELLVQDLTARAALALENAQLYEKAQWNVEVLQQQVAERTVELKQALDKAQAADRAKTRMLSNVTHEIRTPLSSITGFTNLMLSRQLESDKQRQFLTAINDEGWRLTALVNDFLDLQRIESGRQAFRFASVELTTLIAETIQQDCLEHVQRIRLALEPSAPVQADPDRIQQVLTNLVSNALKFSEGEVEVALHQDTTMVCVSIRDFGVGILPEELERIFEVFHRGEIAERERIRGTGLGLALCKEIIAAHQGRIWAESTGEGQGATFRFTLPFASKNT